MARIFRRCPVRFARRVGSVVIGLMLSVGLVPSTGLAAPRPIPETTDDARRLPIPPVDRRSEPIVVMTGGTLIDGRGGAPVANAIVVTQGDRIVSAGPAGSVVVPADAARIIDANWLCDIGNRSVMAKVRSMSRPVPARLDGEWLRFDTPEYGVAPGQAAVLYDGDRVLGGGWIEETIAVEMASAA